CLPFKDASECEAPSASGKVKSSIIVPTAGGAGRSAAFRPLPAIAAIATIKTAPRNRDSAYCFFILLTPFRIGWCDCKDYQRQLGVASVTLHARKTWFVKSCELAPTRCSEYT